jgi:hypothetical protein
MNSSKPQPSLPAGISVEDANRIAAQNPKLASALKTAAAYATKGPTQPTPINTVPSTTRASTAAPPTNAPETDEQRRRRLGLSSTNSNDKNNNLPKNKRNSTRKPKKSHSEDPGLDANGNPQRLRHREYFYEVLANFVGSIAQSFEECNKTRTRLDQLLMMKSLPAPMFATMIPKIIKSYHQIMIPHYENFSSLMKTDVLAKRESMMQEILSGIEQNGDADSVALAIFKDINMSQKWTEFYGNASAQGAILGYVHMLNTVARLHETISAPTLAKLEKMARENYALSVNGESKPTELISLGLSAVKSFHKEEVSMILENIDTILSIIGGEDVLTNFMSKSGLHFEAVNPKAFLAVIRNMSKNPEQMMESTNELSSLVEMDPKDLLTEINNTIQNESKSWSETAQMEALSLQKDIIRIQAEMNRL